MRALCVCVCAGVCVCVCLFVCRVFNVKVNTGTCAPAKLSIVLTTFTAGVFVKRGVAMGT